MSIYIDLTEFLERPFRTGIQRVGGELCRFWPGPELIPVKVTATGAVRLPNSALQSIREFFCASGADAERIRQISRELGQSPAPVTFGESDVLLCPEVFYDPVRLSFYSRLPETLRRRACFIVFDLLPLTHPEYFDANVPHEVICRYFALLRSIPNLAFISRRTQQTFSHRFMRSDGLIGRVTHLGSDGLGPRPAFDQLGRRPPTFAVVGTIEPRKNHALVLDVFERMFERIQNLKLVFIGRLGWVAPEVARRIETAQAKYPGFRLVGSAGDSTIREYVENARATIFVSAAEGFGLPPVESLWLGTPAIVGPETPSLEDIGSTGIRILDSLTPQALREGIVDFLDDTYWARKAREARELSLPTWASFAANVADWVQEVAHHQRAELVR